jgi:hypothetical protein
LFIRRCKLVVLSSFSFRFANCVPGLHVFFRRWVPSRFCSSLNLHIFCRLAKAELPEFGPVQLLVAIYVVFQVEFLKAATLRNLLITLYNLPCWLATEHLCLVHNYVISAGVVAVIKVSAFRRCEIINI